MYGVAIARERRQKIFLVGTSDFLGRDNKMNSVTDVTAERAAKAVIDAGRHWEEFKSAVAAIQTCQFTPNTVVALLADELDIPALDIRRVLDAFTQLPKVYCTVAA